MPGSQRNSSQRLYAMVRQRILEAIEQGVYPVDGQIPTEPELCELHGVSRITVRKAITDLVKNGVLTRLQGKGTFVQGRGERLAYRERFHRFRCGSRQKHPRSGDQAGDHPG
jgi:GntR family frlABCD operon transcriptional regulator